MPKPKYFDPEDPAQVVLRATWVIIRAYLNPEQFRPYFEAPPEDLQRLADTIFDAMWIRLKSGDPRVPLLGEEMADRLFPEDDMNTRYARVLIELMIIRLKLPAHDLYESVNTVGVHAFIVADGPGRTPLGIFDDAHLLHVLRRSLYGRRYHFGVLDALVSDYVGDRWASFVRSVSGSLPGSHSAAKIVERAAELAGVTGVDLRYVRLLAVPWVQEMIEYYRPSP